MIMEIADAMVSTGLKDAGYEYIVLDDGWMAMERDAKGNLLAHPDKFPNGIKHLADYVHSKGLKFGLYNCAGTLTCGGYPGSRGHEYQDALKYAEWDVDYLKYDWCHTDNLNPAEAYITMRDALHAAGRPVLFSICEWGNSNPWEWAGEVGHSWRTTGDIYDCFNCEVDHGTWSSFGVSKIMDIRNNDTLRKYSGPGHWNDMDMLEVGNGGMSFDEDQSHFMLWALLNSPLILGNDIRKMSQQTLDILTNKEVIAINQDELGVQGFKQTEIDSVDVWVKPLKNNEWAVCFLNRSATTKQIEYNWEGTTFEDQINAIKAVFAKDNVFNIRDIYQKKNIGTTKKPLKISLNKYQSLTVRLTK
jgi:alpha-galactosidase